MYAFHPHLTHLQTYCLPLTREKPKKSQGRDFSPFVKIIKVGQMATCWKSRWDQGPLSLCFVGYLIRQLIHEFYPSGVYKEPRLLINLSSPATQHSSSTANQLNNRIFLFCSFFFSFSFYSIWTLHWYSLVYFFKSFNFKFCHF